MNHANTIRRLVPLMALLLACGRAVQVETGAQSPTRTSFFITSAGPGNGASLGGLDGADRHCRSLADAAGITGVSWRAYLSAVAAAGQPAVNARDRIGRGPWYNAKGVMVAQNVDDLHSDNNKLSKRQYQEKGVVVNGGATR